jgi:WD40 repeat protein
VDTVALSPDGKVLASGSADKSVRLWDPADGKELKSLGTHGGSVYAVAFSPDGKKLASAGGDNLVKVWDVPGRKELKALKGHGMAVTGVAFTDDKTVVSIALDRTVRVWNAEDGKEAKKIGPTPDDPFGLAWAAKAKRAAVCGYSGRLAVWDLTAGKEVFTAKVSSPGYCVAVTADGTVLYSGHDNGTVVVTKVSGMK